MPKVICPICKNPYLKSRANLWNEDLCASCFRSGKRVEDEAQVFFEEDQFMEKALSRKDSANYLDLGIEAAKRTYKYANLFQRIANALEVVYALSAIILIVCSFILDFSNSIRFIFICSVLILWIAGYVQTALILGLASFFQMKSSDFLNRNS